MNRETSIHSSDTLVVVDRSAQRRRMVIIGIIAALALFMVGLYVILGRGGEKAQPAPAGGQAAGQMATVSVIVPGQSQVGRVITASGPLGARRDQPVGIAGQGGRVVRVLVDAGSWVRAGQVLAVIDRSVQAQQAAQLSAQIAAARADAALAQNNYERALALKDVTAVGVLSASPALAATVEAFAAGAFDPAPLVSATVGLEEVAAVLSGARPAGAGAGPKVHVDPRL